VTERASIDAEPSVAFASHLRRALDGGDEPEAALAAFGAMLDGDWTEVQTGAYLAALAARRVASDDLVGLALALRARCVPVAHGLPLVLDVCGTGGDGARTINISTIVSFVTAGCGVPTAKHGNRSASGSCGSADVLEACGIPVDVAPEESAARLRRFGFAFLFAQRHHPALRRLAPVRRQLGIRTILNLAGPLAGPAGATHQLAGVPSRELVPIVGEALRALGLRGAAAVHAASGLDEAAGEGPTHVYSFTAGGPGRLWRIDPEALGIAAPLASLAGGDASVNGAALQAILAGENSPRADVVALNAALALLVVGTVGDLREGLIRARTSLQDGSAAAAFEAARRPFPIEAA